MKFDIANKVDLKRAISPVSVANNNAQLSEILDMQGASAAMLAILTGHIGTAGASFTVTMEHGDQHDLSDAEVVPDPDLTGTTVLAGFTGADDHACRKVGYIGSRRYVRATITPASNSSGALIAAVWMLGYLDDAPPPNPPE